MIWRNSAGKPLWQGFSGNQGVKEIYQPLYQKLVDYMVRSTGLEPVRSPTRPSNVRVCQFRHDRRTDIIISPIWGFVKGKAREILVFTVSIARCRPVGERGLRRRASRATASPPGASLAPAHGAALVDVRGAVFPGGPPRGARQGPPLRGRAPER